MRRAALICIPCFVFLLCLGCGKQALISHSSISEYQDRVIAAFGEDYRLTLPAFYDSLELRSYVVPRGGMVDTATQRMILDSILVDTLMWLEALNVDVAPHYRYNRLARARFHDILIRAFFNAQIYDKIPIDSVVVQEYYHENREMFEREEQIYAYHILVTIMGARAGPDSSRFAGVYGPDLEQAVQDYAFEIADIADTAENFSEVALRYSSDNKVNVDRGLIGWVTRGEFIDPFDSVAFALEPGGVSDPYLDAYGWHIIHVTERLEAGLPPLDSTTWPMAINTYRTSQANRLAAHMIDSLRGTLEMMYNEALLDTNVYLVPGSTWAAVVNSEDTLYFDDVRTFEEGLRTQYNVPTTTAEMKKEGLVQLADRFLVVQAARDVGLMDDPKIQEARTEIFQEQAREILALDMRDPDWQPTDSMIAAYYEANADQFQVDKPLVVQQIIVEDSLMGEFVRDQALSGVDFIDLAEQYYPGEPSMRRELADLGAVSRDEVSEEFWAAAMLTPVGEISLPIKTDLGYQLIRVLDVKKSKTLEEAAIDIRKQLRQEHGRAIYRQFRDRLYERYEVRFPSELKSVHIRPRELRIEG